MDAGVFKSNLRDLLTSRGLTQKDLADRIGGESDAERHSYYRWLRRTCSQGLTRCEDRNRDQLLRLCDYFGIHPVERLWSVRLTELQKTADEYGEMLRFVLQMEVPPEKLDWFTARGVDVDLLKQQIRQTYEVLAKTTESLAYGSGSLGEVLKHERERQKPRRRANKKVNVDHFAAMAIERIKTSASNGGNGSQLALSTLGEDGLTDAIRQSLSHDESMTFDEAWANAIVPYVKKVMSEQSVETARQRATYESASNEEVVPEREQENCPNEARLKDEFTELAIAGIQLMTESDQHDECDSVLDEIAKNELREPVDFEDLKSEIRRMLDDLTIGKRSFQTVWSTVITPGLKQWFESRNLVSIYDEILARTSQKR